METKAPTPVVKRDRFNEVIQKLEPIAKRWFEVLKNFIILAALYAISEATSSLVVTVLAAISAILWGVFAIAPIMKWLADQPPRPAGNYPARWIQYLIGIVIVVAFGAFAFIGVDYIAAALLEALKLLAPPR